MDVEFVMKVGDTLPPLDHILCDPEGAPFDVSGATVTLHLTARGATTPSLQEAATVLNGALGLVRYAWPAPQALAPGVYYGEWQVTFGNGAIETFPNSSFFLVKIVEALA